MTFDKDAALDKTKDTAKTVGLFLDNNVRSMNDYVDDISEPYRSLIAMAVPALSLMMFSGFIAGVIIGLVVVARLHPTVMDHLASKV